MTPSFTLLSHPHFTLLSLYCSPPLSIKTMFSTSVYCSSMIANLLKRACQQSLCLFSLKYSLLNPIPSELPLLCWSILAKVTKDLHIATCSHLARPASCVNTRAPSPLGSLKPQFPHFVPPLHPILSHLCQIVLPYTNPNDGAPQSSAWALCSPYFMPLA